jgi:hypothetical protein
MGVEHEAGVPQCQPLCTCEKAGHPRLVFPYRNTKETWAYKKYPKKKVEKPAELRTLRVV